MEENRTYAVPMTIGMLLVLPILYLVSYFALVLPGGIWSGTRTVHYRVGTGIAEYAFWPLEQIDRRLQLRQWDDSP
jgi:hypothetical protein